MSEGYMRTSDIGALLGHTNPGSTRRWIHLRGLKADKRDTETGEKLYSRAEVERVRAEAPGRGARTDLLPPSEGPPPRDHDRDERR